MLLNVHLLTCKHQLVMLSTLDGQAVHTHTHTHPPTHTHTETGEYGSFSIIFNTKNLPRGYDNPQWQQRLSASIVKSIATKSGIKPEFIEVEDMLLTSREDSKITKDLKHKLQKRAAELFLIVNVNLLPTEYNEDAINSIKKV